MLLLLVKLRAKCFFYNKFFVKRFRFFISLFFVLTFLSLNVKAQPLVEIGIKGGETFYLGDRNSTLFNKWQWAMGGYFRWNITDRWATKAQVGYGMITSPMEQNYLDIAAHAEFNFFSDFGNWKSEKWTRYFTPYILAGVGVSTYAVENNRRKFAFNIPFGLGVKVKFAKIINVGLEWTMHKLFEDSFDYLKNPYEYPKTSAFSGKDWLSMCTLSLGFDIGDRGKYCR